MPLILAALLLGMLGAAINYVANRWAPPTFARVVLVLSIVPMIGLLIYCAVAFRLAIKTNDIRYFGADMVFGIALIATLVWVPSVYVGARIGRHIESRIRLALPLTGLHRNSCSSKST